MTWARAAQQQQAITDPRKLWKISPLPGMNLLNPCIRCDPDSMAGRQLAASYGLATGATLVMLTALHLAQHS